MGKANTQKIERKHLTLRTRIKRLVRKTICFSKLEKMHELDYLSIDMNLEFSYNRIFMSVTLPFQLPPLFVLVSDNVYGNPPTGEIKMLAKKLLGFSLAAILAWDVHATVITYETTNLGAGVWQYDYSVTNNTLLSPIEEITIYFPLGLYFDLLSVFEPLNWDNLVAQPDPSLPADGFLDSLTLSAAILPGQTLAPFSVQFTWLGSGAPGSQSFEVVDPASFTVLDSGYTIAFSLPSSVPEPGTIPLAILGVALLLQLSRHRGLSNLSLGAMRKLP